jgi:hypothetical protein
MTYDFLSRLQNGESVETIADEITKSLNEANRQYIKEQELNEKEAAKREIAEELADLMMELLNYYGFDIVACYGEKIKPEGVLEMFDSLVPILKLAANVDVDKKDNPIEEFLKNFVD